jgi:hypothetical protein
MEKRRHIRFLAKDNAFAALGYKFTRVGKIRNIGTGGLAFEYITDEDSDGGAFKIDVFVSGHGFHLSKVPCGVVYDIPVGVSDISPIFYHTLITRQCGVQFGALTEDKRVELNLFLEMYTTGPAP